MDTFAVNYAKSDLTVTLVKNDQTFIAWTWCLEKKDKISYPIFVYNLSLDKRHQILKQNSRKNWRLFDIFSKFLEWNKIEISLSKTESLRVGGSFRFGIFRGSCEKDNTTRRQSEDEWWLRRTERGKETSLSSTQGYDASFPEIGKEDVGSSFGIWPSATKLI